MSQAQNGSTVKVHYTGTLKDGTQFDSSRGREPLELTLGEGAVIPGFESAIVGMAEGETKEITLEPGDAYGDRHEQLVQTIDREQIPPELELEPGQQLQVKSQEGNVVVVTVAEVAEDAVTLDGNHPLAGKTLNFEIEMVEVS
ncbi:MAG TPA: peptidylprolyl isomerase [bacterium]|nr:peptidylprolyl isomerase [bacterium]